MSNVKRYDLNCRNCGSCDMDQCDDGKFVLWTEYERLKAEVERLTKAHSDALADFWNIHKGYFDLKAEVEQLRKQGKQPSA